ncbi:hypothetical protein BOX15_Mlig001329g5 [Macrostomum lignano]|uniref:RRP15-like protein n=2 Tax=Macrostomum lignano TaxID=282301 RepID=A0A267DYB0_9PLAT|nr:hypothetical protein BOX15_Mlig001329g5 [Macrostomum lignano]
MRVAASAKPSAASKQPQAAVRVTIEQDLEEDDNAEEVEDIASDSDASSDRQKPAAGQSKARGKRKSAEASGTAGLANVIRGLLLQTRAPACPILAKALTDRQRFSPAAANATADTGDAAEDSNVDLGRRRRKLTAERRRWLCAGRRKPLSAPNEREAERQLERIACRGVVQLFNAVRAQQRSLESRLAGRSEAGRQRVLSSLSRGDFLDMLAGRRKATDEAKSKSGNNESSSAEEDRQQKKKAKKSWGALSEDYLVKPTLSMKDWDRESSGGSSDAEQPMDEDD